MKGKRRIHASLLVAVLLIIAPARAAGSLYVQNMTAKSARQGLEYTCSYPRVTGLRDRARQQHINVRLKERAMKALKTAELAAEQTADSAVKGSFGFEIKRNEGGILSLALNERLSVAGRTHFTRGGVNIDTVTGRTLKLPDLFCDNADYMAILSGFIRRQISSNGLDKRQLRKFESIRAYEEFYLTKKELVIIPEQGEYFPADSGIIEFAIPFQSLEESLRPSLRLCT